MIIYTVLLYIQPLYIFTLLEDTMNLSLAQYSTHTQNGSLQSNVASSSSKWTYLIANNIKFADKTNYAIKLPKPTSSTLYDWITVIAQAGQCGVLYIENLDFTHLQCQKTMRLCENKGITLVNLTVDSPLPDNILVGPWA